MLWQPSADSYSIIAKQIADRLSSTDVATYARAKRSANSEDYSAWWIEQSQTDNDIESFSFFIWICKYHSS